MNVVASSSPDDNCRAIPRSPARHRHKQDCQVPSAIVDHGQMDCGNAVDVAMVPAVPPSPVERPWKEASASEGPLRPTEFDVLLVVLATASEEDVLCLEVAVDNMVGVQVLQPHSHLDRPLHHLPLGQQHAPLRLQSADRTVERECALEYAHQRARASQQETNECHAASAAAERAREVGTAPSVKITTLAVPHRDVQIGPFAKLFL